MGRQTGSAAGGSEALARLRQALDRRVVDQPSAYRPLGGVLATTRDRLLWRLAPRFPRPLNRSPDAGVSERQSIGAGFNHTAADEVTAKRVLDGWVLLSPHAEWELPAEILWTEDPFGEANWKFQFHTLRWIDPLRRVASRASDRSAEAAELWLAITRSWMDACMFSTNEVAWKDMAVGMRTIELILGFPLVPPYDRTLYIECIRMHANHLANPRNHTRGNHLLHQLQGLYVSARFLRSPAMEKKALALLNDLFQDSYDDEGINAEGALGYHDMNYQWWRALDLRISAESGSVPGFRDRLESARAALVHGVRPDGVLETIGDTGVRKVPTSDGLEETEYVRSKGMRGLAPHSNAACYSSGYAFGRSGWGSGDRDFADQTFYSIRFGDDKPMHGHRDSTSFTVFARGVPWVVDPGMYAYGNSEMRQYMRSRAAHNVVIDTAYSNYPNQSAELLMWKADAESDTVVMSSGPSPKLRTQRAFVYHRPGDFIVIVDVNASASDVSAESSRQLWHLPDGMQVSVGGLGVQLVFGDKTARITWVECGGIDVIVGALEPIQGWVTSAYGEVSPAPVLSVQFPRAGRSYLCAVMTFGEGLPNVRVDRGEEASAVSVSVDGETFQVSIPNFH